MNKKYSIVHPVMDKVINNVFYMHFRFVTTVAFVNG